MAYKRRFRARRGRKVRYSKAKRMVTGHGPSRIERLASGAGKLASLAKALVPIVTAINTEHKYFDVVPAQASIKDPGTNMSLVGFATTLVEGVDEQNRIGSSILGQSYLYRLRLQIKSDNAQTDQFQGCLARVMIFCWKNNQEQNAVQTQKLFQDNTNILSPLNKEYSDQFVILHDDIFPINSTWLPSKTDNTGNFFTSINFKEYYGKCNWHMLYDNANNATSNHLYAYIGADVGQNGINTTNNLLTADQYLRINFTDN